MTKGGSSRNQQPEALATFAATARNKGEKPGSVSLQATPETSPLPASSAQKDAAATKVLREGTLHTEEGAQAAVNALPDRTRTDKTK